LILVLGLEVLGLSNENTTYFLLLIRLKSATKNIMTQDGNAIKILLTNCVILSDVALGLSAGFFVPVLVAISALGGLSCHIMTSSRLCFVGARQGHFPDALALITTDSYTPKPALIFLVGKNAISRNEKSFQGSQTYF
jgi:amino acid transporter